MKVILLEDIENIGKKYELKNVKDGYARNFLIPKNLAKPATRDAMKWLEAQTEIIAKKAEEQLKQVQETASKIDGLEVVIPVKVGDEGQLFEKINVIKITEKLSEAGYKLEKKQIELKEPLASVGEFPVKIRFNDNLEAEIKVVITEEK